MNNELEEVLRDLSGTYSYYKQFEEDPTYIPKSTGYILKLIVSEILKLDNIVKKYYKHEIKEMTKNKETQEWKSEVKKDKQMKKELVWLINTHKKMYSNPEMLAADMISSFKKFKKEGLI